MTCAETVTNCYLCPEHMREHLTPVSIIKEEGSAERCKDVTMNTSDALTNFVDQSSAFPTLEDFNASSTSEALKWTDLVQDTVYHMLLIRSMDHQSFCLSRKLTNPAVVLGHVEC